MASERPNRFLLQLDPELQGQVDDYRYENRIPSRAEAIRQLIVLGLQAVAERRRREA